MGYEKWVFSFSYIFTLLVGLAIAQPNFLASYCFDTGNYTSNSKYQTNLNNVLSSKHNIDSGFYNSSVGRNTDRVNVIGLCRGDVRPESCYSCLNESSHNLIDLCPNQREAIGWTDDCMIRYSNRSIFRNNETTPAFYLYNFNNASNPTQFNKVVRSLLDSLRGEAAAGDSRLKYATGNTSGPGNSTIYGLVQCTPDLSMTQCSDCLSTSLEVLPQCCDGKIGGRVLTPSCNFRYEIGPFYNQTVRAYAPPSQPLAQPPSDVAPPPSDGLTPPPSDGLTPPIATPVNAPPPPGNGGANKVASICVATLMAAGTAILVF